jgi:hypothetical protein
MKRSGLIFWLVFSATWGLLLCALAVLTLSALILLATGSIHVGNTRSETILTWLFFSGGFAAALWFGPRTIYLAYLCFRDLSRVPTRLVGPVYSKRERTADMGRDTDREYFLVVGTQEFVVSPSQYKAVASGDVSSLLYWPNSHAVATVERYAAPPVWPAEVVRLAEALRAGADCSYALRDALREAGYPELAEQFREGRSAAWIADLILGTKRR